MNSSHEEVSRVLSSIEEHSSQEERENQEKNKEFSDIVSSTDSEPIDFDNILPIPHENGSNNQNKYNVDMSNFNLTTFHKIIPEYKGDTESLNIFLSRCDNYYRTLNLEGRQAFLANLIYKLSGRAFAIYQANPIGDWRSLCCNLSAGMADKKSIPTFQNTLLSLKQIPQQSVTDFAEQIRKKNCVIYPIR